MSRYVSYADVSQVTRAGDACLRSYAHRVRGQARLRGQNRRNPSLVITTALVIFSILPYLCIPLSLLPVLFFFQFVACFLLAVSPSFTSLSRCSSFSAGRYGFWTRDMQLLCMYVCNWSRFLLRRATLLFQISCLLFSLSLLFVGNRIKERNRSTRGLIFFEFVRIHCSSSSLCLKKKQDEVYREGRESRLARPPSTSSGSLTLGLRLLAPGFRLVSERESPLFRFPSHPASTGSPVVQRKKGFRAK